MKIHQISVKFFQELNIFEMKGIKIKIIDENSRKTQTETNCL